MIAKRFIRGRRAKRTRINNADIKAIGKKVAHKVLSTKETGKRIEAAAVAQAHPPLRPSTNWHVCWYVWGDMRVNKFTTAEKKDRFIKVIKAAKSGNKHAITALGVGDRSPAVISGIGYWKTFQGDMHD